MRQILKFLVISLILLGLPGGAYSRGVELLVALETNKLDAVADLPQVQAQTVEVLRKRIANLRVPGFKIAPAGGDRILVQLAGLSEAQLELAKRSIKKAGLLTICMVHPDSDELVAARIVEPGYTNLVEARMSEDGRRVTNVIQVRKTPERGLTGKYIKRAYVGLDQFTNKPEILFELDNEGARIFGEVTRQYQPMGNRYFRMAIVLDNVLYSAPRINEPIPGGRVRITGNFTEQEAFELAAVLENPLTVPVRIVEERALDPSVERRLSIRHYAPLFLKLGSYFLGLGIVIGLIVYFSVWRTRGKTSA